MQRKRGGDGCAYAHGVTQLAGRLRVVMIVIDAMPHRHVSPALTPHLWHQAATGGRAPMGAMSLPVSVTYANHAAFVTGADPVVTGLHGNHVWTDDRGWVAAPKEGPRATTLFDRVGAAGGTSVMVAGDQKLVGQMGGSRADVVWPPDGRLPDGTERCAFGYASDAAVLSALEGIDEIDGDVDFALLHLNEPDTTSHLHGPDSAEAIEQYRATDAAYGEIVGRLANGWEHTMVLTVSDHDQETITDFTPVELAEAFSDVDGVEVADEGTAALVHVESGRIDDDRLHAMIRSVDGVEAACALTPEVWMAWTEPGRSFGAPPIPIHGQHGSPRCRTQLAIVSGGDPCVGAVARRIERRQPSVLDWAPMVADLLHVNGQAR